MKILLVESNLILASRVKNSLSGYEVRVGKDWQGEDVVFVNVETNPLEIIKELKEKGAKRVIAYCGHKNIELIKKAQDFGADLVVPNSKLVDAKSLLWENTEGER
jgi:hypothetical protein